MSELIGKMENNSTDRQRLVHWILPALPRLSKETQRCRLVQSLIETSNSDMKLEISNVLVPHTQKLYQSKHGNYVLQKLIECVMPVTALNPLLERLKEEVGKIASHKFGCRILERLMERLGESSSASELWEELVDEAPKLSRNQWANYAMQCMIQLLPHYRSKLVARLADELKDLVVNRYGCFIVQNLLKYSVLDGKDEDCNVILDMFRQLDVLAVLDIACDSHGSYFVEVLKDFGISTSVHQMLVDGKQQLRGSPAGLRVGRHFGIIKE
jgi:hypothetical protein